MIYKFHSNCIPVKGNLRSTICDIQKNNYCFVPNEFIDLFVDGCLDSDCLEQIDADGNIEKYLNYLLAEDFLFSVQNKALSNNFINMNMRWDYPAIISNAIITITEQNYCFAFNTGIIQQLYSLGCTNIELRLTETTSNEMLGYVKSKIANSSFLSIDILMDYNQENIAYSLDLVECNKNIRIIVLCSLDETKLIKDKNFGMGGVIKLKRELKNTNCGIISYNSFEINIETFTESQHHNTCLNRKIAIDAEGNIKNCPSMAKSYGNVSDTTLVDVANNPDFQKIWHIKKDAITKCKDCEFRHICIDCRAYLENPDDQYSAPLKCGYDPYTCEWEEWSVNPLKEKAIHYYGIEELVKKK